jgi:hypothetical protein
LDVGMQMPALVTTENSGVEKSLRIGSMGEIINLPRWATPLSAERN